MATEPMWYDRAGYVDDKVEAIRRRVESAGIVHAVAVERTENGPVFIIVFDEDRTPYEFFRDYGLDLKEVRTVYDTRGVLRMVFGKRQIKAVAKLKNGLEGESGFNAVD